MVTAKALMNSPKRYICHEGGARSGKTYGILQILTWYCRNNPGTKVTVVSHSLPHLKRGALRDFLEIIEGWGMYREEWHNKTDNIYHLPNGSWLEFFGLEDAGKARGPGRDILFVNEANLISRAVFDQLDMRTRGKVIIDLNPADFDSWCYDIADGPDAVKCHSTYLDNPYLSDIQKRVIESYRVADPDGLMWKVYGLGQRGASKEQIYTHYRTFDDMPGKGDVFYGLDFGYTNPSAMVKVELYDGALYVKELLYQSNMTTAELVEKIKAMGIGKAEVYCDAAEPKTIEELYRQGVNAKPADKDVWAGIMKVKSYPLFIQGDNLKRELSQYKWKVDKNDKVLDEPVKDNDHLADAMRYAVHTRLTRKTRTWVGA